MSTPAEIVVPFRDGPSKEWSPDTASKLVARGSGPATQKLVRDTVGQTTAGKKADLLICPTVVADLNGMVSGSGWTLVGSVLSDQGVRAELIWPECKVPAALHLKLDAEMLFFPFDGAVRNGSRWVDGWEAVCGGSING